MLKELDLEFNKLTNLDDVFNHLIVLEILILKLNKITTLNKNVFNNLINLNILDLSENQLTYLDKDLFKPLISLTTLSLVNNMLIDLDINIFNSLIDLKYLFIDTKQKFKFKSNFKFLKKYSL